MTADTESAGRRLQKRLLAVALTATVATTAAGTWVARDRADRNASEQIERAAAEAAASLEDEIVGLTDSLAGADALVGTDGTLDAAAFDRFAAGVLDHHGLEVLSLVERGSDGMPRVVARQGIGAVSPTADGLITPAVGAALRRAAGSGDPAIAPGTSGGANVAVLVHPITLRSGDVAGFVTMAVPSPRVVAVLSEQLSTGTRAVVSAGTAPIVGEPFERRDRTAEAPARLADRAWTVTVGPRPDSDLIAMWSVLGAGVTAALLVGAIALVTARRQRRLLLDIAGLRRARTNDQAAQAMVGHLARAITATEVVEVLRDLLPDSVRAENATLGLVAGDGMLRVVDPAGPEPDSGERLALAGTGSIVERVVADSAPAWLSSPLEWRGDALATALAGPGNALAILPLDAEDTRGVLVVSYARYHVFDPGEQEVLATVAVLAAQALDRGHRYDTEHAAAVAFQQAALPDALPDVPGLSVVARYRPALRHAAVGGDWYDVVPLDHRRTLLVVGDVVGHGMEAAAAMGRLRTALRVIATLEPDPGVILDRLARQVDAIPNAFCSTVLCAVVDTQDGTFTWSRAGHLPPLRVTTDGSELLDQRCAPPLGVVLGVDVAVHTIPISPDDRLVLFTDGIVERRHEGIDAGLDRLAVMATTLADLTPSDFADTLVEAIAPHESQIDDIAILVVGLARVPAVRASVAPT